jgi:uncharacterized protein (TIGR01777 family)
MKALVTGATGFIGRELIKRLDAPVALTRNTKSGPALKLGVRMSAWDLAAGPPPLAAFDGVDSVFHLAGDPVAKGRWTGAKKSRIRSSRVEGTRHLVDALAAMEKRPTCLVSASAVGYYGDRGDEILDEKSGADGSFLAEVCQAWEREALRAEEYGIRVVTIRTGIVLGAGGGALEAMLPPFKFGLGGRLGNGQQWMPWIHIGDLVRLMLYSAVREEVRGGVNGVSPNPVTNREFTRILAGTLRRPALFPAPGPILRLALGEFAGVLLGSQRVIPTAATQAGFEFQYPDLDGALSEILK